MRYECVDLRQIAADISGIDWLSMPDNIAGFRMLYIARNSRSSALLAYPGQWVNENRISIIGKNQDRAAISLNVPGLPMRRGLWEGVVDAFGYWQPTRTEETETLKKKIGVDSVCFYHHGNHILGTQANQDIYWFDHEAKKEVLSGCVRSYRRARVSDFDLFDNTSGGWLISLPEFISRHFPALVQEVDIDGPGTYFTA